MKLKFINEIRKLEGSPKIIKLFSDKEILRYQKLLSTLEGLYIEPTSAVAFAAIEKMFFDKTINISENILVPITGLGLKDKPPV